MFGQVAPDASEDGVLLLACAEVKGGGGEARDLTGLDDAEYSAMPDVPDDICYTIVVRVFYVAV